MSKVRLDARYRGGGGSPGAVPRVRRAGGRAGREGRRAGGREGGRRDGGEGTDGVLAAMFGAARDAGGCPRKRRRRGRGGRGRRSPPGGGAGGRPPVEAGRRAETHQQARARAQALQEGRPADVEALPAEKVGRREASRDTQDAEDDATQHGPDGDGGGSTGRGATAS
ncbi:hypothetical protein THAOC_31644, partial [Thalassiosira oceanica]